MRKYPFGKTESLKFDILPVKQPIGEFFIGKANASEVITICTAQERKKEERDEIEKFFGIQRPLNPERVKEIKKYVQTWDASFPNSVILALNPDCYFFEGNSLYIKRNKKSANIIDGQHRLAGFDANTGKDFEIILSLFPGLEIEEQAYLFSVINTKMTRINPSLAQDLYEFSTINSPEKLAHNIAKSFNQERGNPWFNKIKMLGKKEPGKDPVLSQSAFTKEIVGLICDKRDSYTIRNTIKINKNNRRALKGLYDERKSKRFILWQPFIDNEDKFIYTVLKDYFSAAKEVFSKDWEDGAKILTKTTGYIALMIVFKRIFKEGYSKKDLTKSFFKIYFNVAKRSGKVRDFVSSIYNPGKIGEVNLSKDFLEGMGFK